jgi:hypothetical protein
MDDSSWYQKGLRHRSVAERFSYHCLLLFRFVAFHRSSSPILTQRRALWIGGFFVRSVSLPSVRSVLSALSGLCYFLISFDFKPCLETVFAFRLFFALFCIWRLLIMVDKKRKSLASVATGYEPRCRGDIPDGGKWTMTGKWASRNHQIQAMWGTPLYYLTSRQQEVEHRKKVETAQWL